jgi:hypothetical protein
MDPIAILDRRTLLPHGSAQLTQPVDVVQRVAGVAHPVEHICGFSVLHLTEFFADLSQRYGSAKIDPIDSGEDDGGEEQQEQFPYCGGKSPF